MQALDDGSPSSTGRPSLLELFTTFLVVGVSAVGLGIMQAIRTVPVQRGWMSQEDIDEGMGLALWCSAGSPSGRPPAGPGPRRWR